MIRLQSREELFKEKYWRGKCLPSRIILAPINTGFTRNNRPTTRLLRFHKERSGSSIGISIVGNVAVARDGTANAQTAVLSKQSESGRFAVLARAIRRRGSLAGIQLAHCPEALSPTQKWRVPNFAAETTRLRRLVASMTLEDLDRHVARFLVSARLAAQAGYDVVQIHAAHGYLLSLLISPVINQRDDCYGWSGSWITEFVERLREILGDTLLSIRLSLFTGIIPNSAEAELMRSIAVRLAAAGTDIVDFSAGLYTLDRHLIYPGHKYDFSPYYPWVRDLAGEIPGLVSVAGRFVDLRKLPAEVPENLLVAVGRPLIADPAFTLKSRQGRFEDINYCALKGHCHYFSRGRDRLECGVNSDL